MTSYAVIIKTYFWDDFTRRQLERVRRIATGGDVFLVVNESGGRVQGIEHPEERIVRVTKERAKAAGLEHAGHHDMFWYNGDYHFHLLTRSHGDYDYYIVLEHDAMILGDLGLLVDRLRTMQVDFAAQPIDGRLADWIWLPSCDGIYRLEDVRHWLISIMIFSKRAAHLSYEARIRMGLRLRRGEISGWPFSEASVPTDLALAGVKLTALAEIGSVTWFAQNPPFSEDALDTMTDGFFVHPVLDAPRFIQSILHWYPKLEVYFDDRDDELRRRIRGRALEMFLPRLHGSLVHAGRRDLADRAIHLMRHVGDRAYLRSQGLSPENLGLGKAATQSTISQYSLGPDEACNAVSGPVSGHYMFHTEHEERPWWMVDLRTVSHIEEIKIFNRSEFADRSNGLEVWASCDGRNWDIAGRHEAKAPFGGLDGNPLIIPIRMPSRFVRAELPHPGILHLNQIHVLGLR